MRIAAILLSAILAVSAAPAFGQVAEITRTLKDASSPRILVAAHRAAWDVPGAPENSFPSIERAIALGVDIIEIDVRLTKDGVPVLMHDPKVDRTTTGKGAIAELMFEDVKKLRLLDNTGKPTDLKVPTLIQALEKAKGKIIVDLDLKADDIEPILSRVIEAGVMDQTFFFDPDVAHLQKFTAIRPDTLLFPRAGSVDQLKTLGAQLKPEIIHIDVEYNADGIRPAAMATDTRMWINAMGEPDKLLLQGKGKEAIEPLLKHGASIVQTDQPGAVIAYLEATGRR